MNLYIVRHTEAEPGSQTLSDKERKITPRGREYLANSIAHWKKLMPLPEVIISSPYIRAMETAKVIHTELGLSEPVHIENVLASGAIPSLVQKFLTVHSSDSILLVGHEPDCSALLSHFVANGSRIADFLPGAIAWIQFNSSIRSDAGLLRLFMGPVTK